MHKVALRLYIRVLTEVINSIGDATIEVEVPNGEFDNFFMH